MTTLDIRLSTEFTIVDHTQPLARSMKEDAGQVEKDIRKVVMFAQIPWMFPDLRRITFTINKSSPPSSIPVDMRLVRQIGQKLEEYRQFVVKDWFDSEDSCLLFCERI